MSVRDILESRWENPEHKKLILYVYQRYQRLRNSRYNYMREALLHAIENPVSGLQEEEEYSYSQGDGSGGTFLEKIFDSEDLGDYSDVILLTVKAGSDVNQKAFFGRSQTTLLGVTAREGRMDVAEQLLALGADPNIKGGSLFRSPLRLARDHQMIDLLLAAGADPDLSLPLGKAAKRNDFGAIHRLVAAGANPALVKGRDLYEMPTEDLERFLDVSGYSLTSPRKEGDSLLYLVAEHVYNSECEHWRRKLDMLMKRPVDREQAGEYAERLAQDYQ